MTLKEITKSVHDLKQQLGHELLLSKIDELISMSNDLDNEISIWEEKAKSDKYNDQFLASSKIEKMFVDLQLSILLT